MADERVNVGNFPKVLTPNATTYGSQVAQAYRFIPPQGSGLNYQPGTEPFWMTADNLERVNTDLLRQYNLYNPASLSIADRLASDSNVLITRGLMDFQGRRIPNLLTEAEQQYFGSGGFEGSYGAASGLPTIEGPARGAGFAEYDPAQSTESRVTWLALNSPGALRAIVDSGMNPEDVATVHNLFVARAAADKAMKYAMAGETAASLQVVSALPTRMRLLAAVFVDEAWQAAVKESQVQLAQEQEQERKQSTTTQFDPATGKILTPTVADDGLGGMVPVSARADWQNPDIDVFGRLMNALLWPVEQSIRAARVVGMTYATADNPDLLVTPVGGPTPDTSNPAAQIAALWNATSENFISQESYNNLVDEFGKPDTDLMIAYYQAATSDAQDAVPQFWASIEDNPRAIAFITSAMRGENVGGSERATELFASVAASDQGNLGNIIANDIGFRPGTAPFGVTRDVTNVASWFVLDPTIYASKAFRAINLARYGLNAALTKTGGSISRVILENKGVSRIYDQFGSSLRRISEESDAYVKSQLLRDHTQSFTGPESRFFDAVHTEIGLDKGLFTAEDWARYYAQVDDAERLARGGAVPIQVKVPISGAKRGMEYLQQFTPEARMQAAEEAGVALGASGARSTQAAETFSQHIAAQTGNRNLYVPHMSAAKAWIAEQTRGLTMDTARAGRLAGAAFDDILGPDWRNLPSEERVSALVRALDDPKMAESLGYSLSDFKAMSDGGRRTWAARVLDFLFPGERGKYIGLVRVEKDAAGGTELVRQKGWARKRWWNGGAGFSESYLRVREQWRRLTARIPDVRRGIEVDTAKDADKVYQMAMAAGVGRDASDLLRLMWIEANTAQRQNMMIGLTRTFLKASGVHAVSPKAESEILELMTGIRSGELYAPDQVKRLAGVLADLSLTANQRRAELMAAAEAVLATDARVLRESEAKQRLDDLRVTGADNIFIEAARAEYRAAKKAANAARKETTGSVPSVEQIRKDLEVEARKPGGSLEAGKYNPSVLGNGKSSALYMAQTEDRMAVVNFQKLDHYTARKSMLNALLFNNRGGQFLTDMWVLGTLYGPRFQLRNGIEDVGMYALTSGKVGSFVRGRKVSQAIDQAVARENADFAAKKAAFDQARRQLGATRKLHADGQATVADVEKAQRKFDEAKDVYGKAREQFGEHAKLGVVRTVLVGLSEKATYGPDNMVRDGILARVAQFLVPTTSKWERRLAAESGREAVAELAARSVLRQKLIFAGKDENVRSFIGRIRRAKSIDDLSPADREILRYEEELLNSPWGMQFKDDAAEVTMHLSDSTLPAVDDMGNLTYIDGDLYRRVWLDGGYETEYVAGKKLNETQARAMTAHLRFMTEKYGLNQVALNRLPAYWTAVNRAGGADQVRVDEIIAAVLNEARASRDWVLIRQRFRLIDDAGEYALVERMLDDMTHTFTTRKGDWNANLYGALRHTDDKGLPYFTLGDDVDNPAVHEVDFMTGKFEHPESLLVLRGEAALVKHERSASQALSALTWEPMGRSLARMTRNPIWYGNYIEARSQMRSLESKYAAIFGEKIASKMMTDVASERAYKLTMSYVDNPAVRTNLAWQVRNIARYYRAQEDFARRMIRMGKFEPMGYWKATLAWQASQDVGFVHKDQYGDEYFVYPFTAPGIALMQHLSNFFGFTNAKYGVAPLSFGGKVQWLSPSMDPGQWLPTLSSPWTAVTLQPLLRSMPVAEDFFKSLERAAFGDIAAETSVKSSFDGPAGNFVSSVYSALPPNFKKLQTLATAFLQGDQPGSLGYRMMVKTLTAQSAAGNVPTPQEMADDVVRGEFLDDLQRRTIEMSVLSLIFGLFAPASPQLMEDTASLAARQAGYEALKPAFRDMIQSSVANGKTWDDAYITWMSAHPEDGIFAVSMTAGSQGGYVAPTLNNVEYLKQNKDIWDQSPRGFALFMPDGRASVDDDIKALQALRMFNASEYKSVEDMAKEMVAVRGYVSYKQLEATISREGKGIQQYDTNGDTTPEWRAHEATAERARRTLRARTGGLAYRLFSREQKTQDQWVADAWQAVQAGRALAARGNEYAKSALPFIDAYRQFSTDFTNIKRNPGLYADPDGERSKMYDVWKLIVRNWVSSNPAMPEEQRIALIDTFTGALEPNWDVVY